MATLHGVNPLDSLNQAASLWCNKTLAQLRAEAEREKTGVAFDALRPTGGPRLMMVVCITGAQASRLLQHVTLVEEGPRAAWSAISLFDFVSRSMHGRALAFEIERDESGMVGALAISAAGPDSISKLEALLKP